MGGLRPTMQGDPPGRGVCSASPVTRSAIGDPNQISWAIKKIFFKTNRFLGETKHLLIN
jgi:hypothetical protein